MLVNLVSGVHGAIHETATSLFPIGRLTLIGSGQPNIMGASVSAKRDNYMRLSIVDVIKKKIKKYPLVIGY